MYSTKRLKFLALFFLLIPYFASPQGFELHNGDLIFQQACSGESVGNAIKNVTQSAGSYQFTHVGVVYIPDGKDSIFVIEATIPEVRVVSLKEYLFKKGSGGCYPVSVAGRVKPAYQHCIPAALQEALKLVGKSYDYGFVLNNDKYYCSELIYDIFMNANQGKPVFELNKMTFRQKDSDQTDDNWIRYFSEKGLGIPEGEWGINPGAMSRSKVIDMLGEIHYSATRRGSSNTIYGLLTDSLGRCVHYASEKDIVANKCFVCKKYYACYQCHNLCENHLLSPWPVHLNDSSQKIVLCGNCFREISYQAYSRDYVCPLCRKDFNPKCALHKEIYFMFER
ncbi:MAG: hypothetical protein BGN96_02460 [Bacteroidales bacterium 45-6]|nr:MAG: hypothetical protein BGN96_02460 [Bacteroidales bacterium 45-6]